MTTEEQNADLHLASVLREIDTFTDKYEFNFQLWGEDRYTVYIEKGGIDMTSFGGCETMIEVLEEALNWCYTKNRVSHKDRIKLFT